MTSRDFCYWLQGFFEVAKPQVLQSDEIRLIQEHLALVFAAEVQPPHAGITIGGPPPTRYC